MKQFKLWLKHFFLDGDLTKPYCYSYENYEGKVVCATLEEIISHVKGLYESPYGVGANIYEYFLGGSRRHPSVFEFIQRVPVTVDEARAAWQNANKQQNEWFIANQHKPMITGMMTPEEPEFVRNYLESKSIQWK